MFTNDERTDMILIFGECGKNAVAASNLYRQRYPNRRAPSDTIFRRLEAHLRASWPSFKRNRPRTATCPDNEIAVIEAVTQDPHVSQKFISRQVGISQASVCRILKANRFHPYHVQLVQELKPTDYPKRIQFCNFVRRQTDLNPNFVNLVLFSDEAKFSNNGSVNRHNCHYYAQENPKWIRMAHFQTVYSVNVWCGILGDHIIGPYFFREHLNGLNYLNFLRNELPALLEDVELNVRQHMWFQQDGAPPHYHRIVRAYLDAQLFDRWIGRGSVNAWPPRSPDITPLDFFLWGMVKDRVYKTPILNINDLQNRIIEACRSITPGLLQRVRLSFMNRITACELSNGRNFEHLI